MWKSLNAISGRWGVSVFLGVVPENDTTTARKPAPSMAQSAGVDFVTVGMPAYVGHNVGAIAADRVVKNSEGKPVV